MQNLRSLQHIWMKVQLKTCSCCNSLSRYEKVCD